MRHWILCWISSTYCFCHCPGLSGYWLHCWHRSSTRGMQCWASYVLCGKEVTVYQRHTHPLPLYGVIETVKHYLLSRLAKGYLSPLKCSLMSLLTIARSGPQTCSWRLWAKRQVSVFENYCLNKTHLVSIHNCACIIIGRKFVFVWLV